MTLPLSLCLDVAKVAYQLRCNGDRLDTAILAQFDADLRSAVETTLRGSLSDDAWVQATMAVPAVGLDLREASAIALPAFIASRVAARPPALLMAQHAEQAGLLDLSRFR